MKKIIFYIFLLTFFLLVSLILILSSIGIETDRFNTFIQKKINLSNNNISLELNTVKFKLDIKEISLFLNTESPILQYRRISIPARNIKVYIDFISLIKADPNIKKINIVFDNIDINQIKKISNSFKPSNFTSFVKNKIKAGKVNTVLEVYLTKENLLENFIARGSVSDLNAEIKKNLSLNKTEFKFFVDKTDILLTNILGELGPYKIKDGDLKLEMSSEINLETNFYTNLNYDDKKVQYKDFLKDFSLLKEVSNLKAELKNNFLLRLDKTYKIKDYKLKSSGKIIEANFNFEKPLKNYFGKKKIDYLAIKSSEIESSFSPKKNYAKIIGKYSLDKEKFLSFDLEGDLSKKLTKLKFRGDYDKEIKFEPINYLKPNKKVANISLDLEKQKKIFKIKEFILKDEKSSFLINDLNFNQSKILSLKKISIKTELNGRLNNDFSISSEDKISISGNHFDAKNIPKILNRENKTNIFSNINNDIEIDFKNISAPLSERIKNFKLIGKIEKGKFTKISAKGDFGNNNYLDISMKKDKVSQKKYLEIYSDLTKPLLTEFNFFKGLTGGKLLYSSIINKKNYSSKLKIENFKVVNAPGMVKLLSLADLGGLADLAEGEGLSFDILEISMEKNNELLKLNEILALGPSISVLMEGYQDKSITSLRGTLIPAKTLNKLISKIPLIGDIIIPKEVGEGLFGISFKMKGPPGAIKTTINPIRTLTPRFIQKIVDRNKNLK